jgi:hypothetical protein
LSGVWWNDSSWDWEEGESPRDNEGQECSSWPRPIGIAGNKSRDNDNEVINRKKRRRISTHDLLFPTPALALNSLRTLRADFLKKPEKKRKISSPGDYDRNLLTAAIFIKLSDNISLAPIHKQVISTIADANRKLLFAVVPLKRRRWKKKRSKNRFREVF